MSYRIRLLETEEGWAVSCLDLPGCHSQGNSREEALANIRSSISIDNRRPRTSGKSEQIPATLITTRGTAAAAALTAALDQPSRA